MRRSPTQSLKYAIALLVLSSACGSTRGAEEPARSQTTPTRPPPVPASTVPGSTGPGSTGPGSTGPGSTGPAAEPPGAAAPIVRPTRLEDLAWLAGTWRLPRPLGFVEEVWVPAAGQAMLGVGRTITDGRMTSFEFLRIEQRGEGLVYVAQPQGRAATEFEMVEGDAERVRFENLRHDFPRWIRYERTGVSSMRTTIGSDEREIQFAYGRLR